MSRKFEVVSKQYIKNNFSEHLLPQRMTKNSAGYDFFINNSGVTIFPGATINIWTDIKAQMEDDEVLLLFIRSSLANKKGLRLKNAVGIIDADYYSNNENDGNICFCVTNDSQSIVELKMYDRIGQGIFVKYLKTDDNDYPHQERDGGIGSTENKE